MLINSISELFLLTLLVSMATLWCKTIHTRDSNSRQIIRSQPIIMSAVSQLRPRIWQTKTPRRIQRTRRIAKVIKDHWKGIKFKKSLKAQPARTKVLYISQPWRKQTKTRWTKTFRTLNLSTTQFTQAVSRDIPYAKAFTWMLNNCKWHVCNHSRAMILICRSWQKLRLPR